MVGDRHGQADGLGPQAVAGLSTQKPVTQPLAAVKPVISWMWDVNVVASVRVWSQAPYRRTGSMARMPFARKFAGSRLCCDLSTIRCFPRWGSGISLRSPSIFLKL